MNCYELGLYEKAMPNGLSLKEKLKITKESGFDCLEISIDESDEKLARLNWSASLRRSLVDEMYDVGIPIGSICLSAHRKYPLGHPDAAVRSRSLVIMESALALAADLGIRMIQLAGYDVYYEPASEGTRKNFSENLRICVEAAARYGIILGFETMETPFMDTVEKAMCFVREINSPYLQIYPDLGNLTNAACLYGSDVAKDIRAGTGRIAAMHLKETDEGKYRDMMYGEGRVDFRAGIKIAWDLGVRRFAAEFWEREDWQKRIKYAHDYIRPRIEDVRKESVQ